MVNYRLATEDDYSRINAFHNRIYQKNRTMDQFYWQFHNCPFGKSIYVLAEVEGKIVGTNCVIPIELIGAGNLKIKSGKSEDTLVDPDFRGQNIFYNIYDFLFEKCSEAGIEVIWGFTSALKPFKKLGFEIPFHHKQSLAVNGVKTSFEYISSLNPQNTTVDKLKIYGLCIWSKLRFKFAKSNEAPSIQVIEIPKDKEQVSRLISENLSKYPELFAINQSSEFQNWRVYENPYYYKTHTYKVSSQAGEVLGIIVFNSSEQGVAYLNHCTLHPTLNQQARVAVLRNVTKQLFNSDIKLVRTWNFETNSLNITEASALDKSGYTLLDRGIGFVWKELSPISVSASNFNLSRIATQGNI